MQSSQKSLVQSLRVVLSIVPRKQKQKFWFLFFVAFVGMLMEITIAGLIALMAAVFASTTSVLNNPYLLWLKQFSGSTFLDDPRLLALAVLCLVLLAIIFKNLLAMFQQWQMATFSESVAMAGREHLFRFYLRAPFLWLLNRGSTELLFSLGACGHLSTSLLAMLNICSNSLMLLGFCVSLLLAAPVPSLIFLCTTAVAGFFVLKITRRIVNTYSLRVYTADRGLHGIQQMAVHALKEMRIYGREAAIFNGYQQKLKESKRAKERQITVLRLPVSALEILGFLTLLAVMCYLVFVQDAGMARVSGIMGFMAAAAWRALPVANRTVEASNGLRTTLPYLNKLAEVIELEKELSSELLPPFDKREMKIEFKNSIQVKDLTFVYPNSCEPALKHVNLSIKRGQMVGLVGFSGSGKSTLANILTGLISPAKGEVLIDEQVLTKENMFGWLDKIGYVAQAPVLLDASLAENIALSRWGEEVDRERVLTCCEMAALNFLEDLDDGIDTMLGERGVRLSGGEAQRVAIARALYSNPELIIFDEATSALDMRNEQAIHDTILTLHNQVTMVIIAHRLSTVENCDYLVWLDRGQVKMQGCVGDVLPEYKLFLRQQSSS